MISQTKQRELSSLGDQTYSYKVSKNALTKRSFLKNGTSNVCFYYRKITNNPEILISSNPVPSDSHIVQYTFWTNRLLEAAKNQRALSDMKFRFRRGSLIADAIKVVVNAAVAATEDEKWR